MVSWIHSQYSSWMVVDFLAGLFVSALLEVLRLIGLGDVELQLPQPAGPEFVQRSDLDFELRVDGFLERVAAFDEVLPGAVYGLRQEPREGRHVHGRLTVGVAPAPQAPFARPGS